MRVLVFFFIFVILMSSSLATSILLNAGNVYYVNVETGNMTEKWVGLNINYSKIGNEEIYFNQSGVYNVTFPRSDLVVVLPIQPVNFDYGDLESVSIDDLKCCGLFSESTFPVFYPDYYSSDGPNATFCCKSHTINLNGHELNSFMIKVSGDYEYLVKYKNVPAFLSFGGSHLILPANATYFVYSVNFPVEKRRFPQPLKFLYNYSGKFTNEPFVIYVYRLGKPVSNVKVIAYLNGVVIASGKTDENGVVKFNFEFPGIYEFVLSKPGYCTEKFYTEIFNKVHYSISVNPNYTEVNLPICISVNADGKPMTSFVYMIYPNNSVKKLLVSDNYCFVPNQIGKYYLILERDPTVEVSFIVYGTPNHILYLNLEVYPEIYTFYTYFILIFTSLISVLIFLSSSTLDHLSKR